MRARLAVATTVLLLVAGLAAGQTVDPVAELNAAKTDINAALALNPKQAVRTRLVSARTHIDNALAAMQTTTTTAAPTTTVAPTTTAAPTTTQAPTTTIAPTTTVAPTTTTTAPGGQQFPNPANTGVPAGWTPALTRTTTLTVNTAGAIIENIRFTNGADLIINAPNVTVRRVEMVGSSYIQNDPGGSPCNAGLLIEDVSIISAPGQVGGIPGAVIGTGSYTARRVEINAAEEGFRVGGKDQGCGPVSISDSYIKIIPPAVCGDWHGDGIQGWQGPALTIRNVTIDFNETACQGTAPVFYPHSQGNTSVDIDRLLVKGGGYPFRNGMPGKVLNLKIVDGSWRYGPIDVKCSVITQWSAEIVTIDSAYQPTTVRSQACNTEGGN